MFLFTGKMLTGIINRGTIVSQYVALGNTVIPLTHCKAIIYYASQKLFKKKNQPKNFTLFFFLVLYSKYGHGF